MRITVRGDDLELRHGETVLQALTRQGIGLPAGCRAGVCRACLVRAVRGDPGPAGRAGLDDAMQADGYFLACMARPAADLTVALAEEEIFAPAELLSVAPIGAGVIRVRVRPLRPLDFRAGQHVAVRTGAGIVRVYSIANLPAEARRDGVEFHVRIYRGGAMSGWLASAAPGDTISLGRPAGTCCYLPEDPGCPLLLAGTGTGIAPLAAILRDALVQGHHGSVVIIQGATGPDGLYPCQLGYPDRLGSSGERGYPAQHRDERLVAGEARASSVRLRTCLLARGEDIAAVAASELSELPEPASARAYLCGGARAVTRMRRALFMAGLSLRRIQCDEFAPATGE